MYVIIGVSPVAILVLLSVMFFLIYWIWRRQKNKKDTILRSSKHINQNSNQANQNNSKSDDHNPNETTPLLKG